MFTTMIEWQRQNLIKIDDVAIAVRSGDNKIRIKYADQLVGKGALGGGFWNSLISMISNDPVVGSDADSAVNTLIAEHKSKKFAQRKVKQTEACLDPYFIREISESFALGMSAIFVYTRQGNMDKILPELKKIKGRLIKSSLAWEDEQSLQKAFGVEEKIKPKDPLDIIGNIG
jgi:uncharacterized membrane protein